MGRLEGKIAVILGAAGRDNMGQVMARTFAREGARVLVAGRQPESLREIAAEIGGHDATCDITRKPDVDALADLALELFGRIDVAVNCTGWGLMARLLDTTEEQLDRLAALQFKGPYFFLQSFVSRMIPTGGGSIIQVSSASVHALLNNHAAYIATKAAGEALVRCFANEFGAQGVRVNSIAPGLTSTPMTEKEVQMPGLAEAFVKEYPLGRIGTTQDVADAALWLAGDECFMTGQVLQVNGGLTLRRNPTQREISTSLRAHAPPKAAG
ncbi:MAG TPA: SDR family oxidoreductase [Steroidobacteraceae bacterium]|nr:SDR family oxidoreductase [Steroidobacteraceae bacterium]